MIRQRTRLGGTVSIRWSLIRSFSGIVLVSSLSVLLLMTIRASQTEQELSERLISSGTSQVVRALDGFLRPVQVNTSLGVSWGRSGQLSISGVVEGEVGRVSDRQSHTASVLARLLLPVLAAHPEASSVQIATDRGEGFLLLENGPGFLVRVVNRAAWGQQTLWFNADSDGNLSDPQWKTVDYDPRLREWFVKLENAADGEVVWTDPYIFFTTGEPGITASAAWVDDGVRHVIAWDVLLTSISSFTRELATALSPRSNILVMTRDKRVVGLPRHEHYDDPETALAHALKPASQLLPAEARALIDAWEGSESAESFHFQTDDYSWWAGLQEYRVSESLPLDIAVVVPDIDILHDLARQRVMILAAAVTTLLAALLYSVVLARSYSRPLEALAEQSRKLRDMDFSRNEEVQADFREIRSLVEAHEQSLSALQSFSRYVPVELVSELVETNQVARIGGRSEDLTIMFSDIADFTSITERTPADALAEQLAAYFQLTIDVLQQHDATVDKLIGDSVMAFWGAPKPVPEHRLRALEAIKEVREKLDALNRKWQAEGREPFHTRFGLASGNVVVGNFGAPTRLAYTVFGDTVNLASRLEALNKQYGTRVIAADDVVESYLERFSFRRLDSVRVKGRSSAVWIYELLEENRDASLARDYERAWQLYADRKFEEAISLLDEALKQADDGAAARLREVCRNLSCNPPPAGWSPVTNLENK